MCSAQRTPAEIGSLPSCSGTTSAACNWRSTCARHSGGKVHVDVVRSWCLREHQAEKFQLFKQRLDALTLTKAVRPRWNGRRGR
jgi:hypothetical protein